MTFELRPSSNAAFAERIRSAEARKQQELSSTCRRPRATDMRTTKRRWDLEAEQEMRRIANQYREVWE